MPGRRPSSAPVRGRTQTTPSAPYPPVGQTPNGRGGGMQEDWIESSNAENAPKLQEVTSPRLRESEGLHEEQRQRTITVAMGNGTQAMQLTERFK
eukprot:7099280-Lingulodinium_polyedra.AAC.1